jgi:hypothetical protein
MIGPAIEKAPYAELGLWAEGLAGAVPHMAAAAARVCARAGDRLTKEMAWYTISDVLIDLTEALCAVAVWMEPAEAARAYAGAAKAYVRAITEERISGDLRPMVAALAQITSRMEPTQACAAWSETADGLANKMARALGGQLPPSAGGVRRLAEGLGVVAAQMGPAHVEDVAGVRRRDRCCFGDQRHRKRRIDGRRLAGVEVGEPLHVGVEPLSDFFHR